MASSQVVAIVDDDEAVRESTAALLHSVGFEVELFANGEDFLELNQDSFTCILLDMRMPRYDGIEVLRQLGERASFPPVVVLTGHGDLSLAVEAMKLGAMDFIEKPYEPARLVNALNLAISNRQHNHQKVAPSKESLALVGMLSARQRQILCRMLSGEPNKIIAWKLGLSVRTVEAYRAQVMVRLHVHSTVEAIQIAWAAGLTAPDRTGPPPA